MPRRATESKLRYLQVADDLRSSIAAGQFKVGDQLPSVRDLQERYGFAAMTIRHAYDLLRQEGIVTSHQGTGAFVQTIPASDQQPLDQQVSELVARLDSLESRVDKLESHGPQSTIGEEDPP